MGFKGLIISQRSKDFMNTIFSKTIYGPDAIKLETIKVLKFRQV